MAAVQTNKYPSGMAGGRSLDIDVGQGEIVTVVLMAADGSDLPANLQAPILRKVNTLYRQMPDNVALPAMLTTRVWEVVFNSPGTYAIMVPPTDKNVVVEEFR